MHNIPLALIGAIAAGVVVLAVVGFSALRMRRRRRDAKVRSFHDRWQDVQHLCGKSATWSQAMLDADKLLDDALKATGYKGRMMGERLVSAQRTLTDNDGVWFGHKLCNKIAHEEVTRLYKRDVQAALRGMRQAMIDLGVL